MKSLGLLILASPLASLGACRAATECPVPSASVQASLIKKSIAHTIEHESRMNRSFDANNIRDGCCRILNDKEVRSNLALVEAGASNSCYVTLVRWRSPKATYGDREQYLFFDANQEVVSETGI